MKNLTIAGLLIMTVLSSGATEKRAGKPLAKTSAMTIDMTVTEKGFEPKSIDVVPGSSVKLKITRKTDSTCATAVQVPAKNLKADLPLNKTVVLDLGVLDKGEIRFGCTMDMMISGLIHVK